MIGFGMPGMSEWLVILVIVLIFFGAGRLPEVFGQAGKALKSFKDGADGRNAAGEPGAEPRGEKARKQIPADADDLDDDTDGQKATAEPQKKSGE